MPSRMPERTRRPVATRRDLGSDHLPICHPFPSRTGLRRAGEPLPNPPLCPAYTTKPPALQPRFQARERGVAALAEPTPGQEHARAALPEKDEVRTRAWPLGKAPAAAVRVRPGSTGSTRRGTASPGPVRDVSARRWAGPSGTWQARRPPSIRAGNRSQPTTPQELAECHGAGRPGPAIFPCNATGFQLGIRCTAAIFFFAVAPQAKHDPDHIIALVLEEGGSNGTVHTAAHS